MARAVTINPRKRRWSSNGNQLLLMLLPCLFFFAVFNYLPVLGLIISFKDLNLSLGIWQSEWVGLDNYRTLFSSDEFLLALRNTLVISTLKLLFGFFAPIVLALMLNEVRLALVKRGIQTITYIPYFLSWVVLGGIFKMVLAQDGPINQVLIHIGVDPVAFLTSDIWFIFILIATSVWQTAGYGAVIYLAALAGISPDLYEAAKIDGAGRWQQTRHITLPALVPTMVVLFILSMGQLMNAGFDQVYNLYNPMVYNVSDIVETYVLRHMQLLDFGIASSANLFDSVFAMVLIIGVNFLVKKVSRGEHGIW